MKFFKKDGKRSTQQIDQKILMYLFTESQKDWKTVENSVREESIDGIKDDVFLELTVRSHKRQIYENRNRPQNYGDVNSKL